MSDQGNAIMDPLIRDLMESAATGEAAKLFLQSAMGRSITARAVSEIDEALAELVEADPGDSRLIAEIQRRIKVPAQAISWLTDAITEGDNALARLHDDS